MTATAYERVVGALRDQGLIVRENGSKAMAQCPAHDDRNPSLSIGPRRRRQGHGREVLRRMRYPPTY